MRHPKNILITGASSGLGAALALTYAAPSIRLALHGRNPDRLATIATQARVKGALVDVKNGDIRDGESLATWLKQKDQENPFDLIIANAGISAGTEAGTEGLTQIEAIFSTNVNGVLNTIAPLLPFFLQRQHGQIAIISSLASFHGLRGSAAYCASKAAIRVYGEALRRQCYPFGVQINVVCPGFIQSPMTDVNRFKMPFLMSAEKAARHIQKGLLRNRPRLAFPFPLYALIRGISIFPQSWLDKGFTYLPKKGS